MDNLNNQGLLRFSNKKPYRELIVAVDSNGAIGSRGGLGFSCKEDMAWFKWYTMGKVLWCGKNTYNGIKHLPGRTVNKLNRGEFPAGCYVGGGQVYSSVISMVDRAVVTHLKTAINDPDTFFNLRELRGFAKTTVVRDESWGRVVIYERV